MNPKRTRVRDDAVFPWLEARDSAIAAYLDKCDPTRFTSSDFRQIRALLVMKAPVELRKLTPLPEEPFSLAEVLFICLLRNQPSVPDLPVAAPVSSSSAVSVSATSLLDKATGVLDKSLPLREDVLSKSEWTCERNECKGQCTKTLLGLYKRLGLFLRNVHSLTCTTDMYALRPADWALMERDIGEFIIAHVDRDLRNNNVPVRLARLGLRAMCECAALFDVLMPSQEVKSLLSDRLLYDVFEERRLKVLDQLETRALEYMTSHKKQVSEMFQRRCFRLACRFFFPAMAMQSYTVNNNERILPRTDEAVSILQRELVRLDAEEDHMYLFIDSNKQLMSTGKSKDNPLLQQAQAKDPLTVAFLFFEQFREETKENFVDNWLLLPESVSFPERRARLLTSQPSKSLKAVPIVTVFASKVALWYDKHYTDYGKRLSDALAAWIVYARDLFRGDLHAFGDSGSVRTFFSKRFPL